MRIGSFSFYSQICLCILMNEDMMRDLIALVGPLLFYNSTRIAYRN